MHAGLGHALTRRALEEPTESWELPSWTPLVAFADLIVFLPVVLIVTYTLGSIFPTLAMVEDPNPPAYEPVALDEGATDQGPAGPIPGKPITSSLRATRRLLQSVAGWKSYFRGIVCAFVYSLIVGFLDLFFQSSLPLIPIGNLLGLLATAQLSAAWTHIVISAPSDRPFYRRLPPFKKTFEATCFPILLLWLSSMASIYIPIWIGKAMGLTLSDVFTPNPDARTNSKLIALSLNSIVLSLLTVVPASVLLTRIQASLLPPDESTIVPFDRSFQGRLEPEIVGKRSFVGMRDALATFPKSSWIRLYKLYAKTFGILFVVEFVIVAVVMVEMALIASAAKKA